MLDKPAYLRDFLHSRLGLLIADANEAGFSTTDVLAGLRNELDRQRHGYEKDPDPADDPDNGATDADRSQIQEDVVADIDTEAGVPRAA
jgi:hypothetical protein